MPNAVLEAMAWGLPVIATNSGGLPTVIEDDLNGYLVSMRDPNSLRERIKTVIQNPKKRKQIGENARQYVKDNHSWDSLVSEVEEIYVKLLMDKGDLEE